MIKPSIRGIKDMSVERLNKLTADELKFVLRIADKSIRASLKRFSNKNIASPATKALMSSGGNISVRGKNINQLRAELSRARKFLNAKTSTISGYKKVKKDLSERLKAEFTESGEAKLWVVYEKMKSLHPDTFSGKDGSTRLQKLISDIISNGNKDMTIEEILSKADEELNRLYEETIEYENSFSDIFDFWEDI